MTRRTIEVTEDLYEYILRVSVREPDVLARLRNETSRLKWSQMQISPDQGQFMRLVNEILGTRRALEIGVFTGYSAISVALAMPEDGRLVACDINEDYAAIARRYFEEAGVSHKIDFRIGPAADTLEKLLSDGQGETFDFAFVDADKQGYLDYYERCLELLRPGGVVAFDNVLWGGSVADERDQEPGTLAIRALNERLGSDERVSISLVPIGDGVTLARKRG